MALNANGIYVNGTKVDDLSIPLNFFSLVEQKTAQIGFYKVIKEVEQLMIK